MKNRIIAILCICMLVSGCAKSAVTDNDSMAAPNAVTDSGSTAAETAATDSSSTAAESKSEASAEDTTGISTDNPEDAKVNDMAVGETYHGFLLKEINESKLLNSTIYSFIHEGSGAELVYMKNEDPECSFTIGYKTPYVDETDTNHVFEHAIIGSSDKYPSKNLFFDLSNKSYATYINASTSYTTTLYPISSYSQEQLITLMDAYMSCMVAPGVLKDENLFKREAIRFELDDPDGEIGINGTVYAEDFGLLSNQTFAVYNALLDVLYPGEIASNNIGRAQYHYDDLTYEHTIETYERCYHFDNSLICLYGNMDIDRFLAFLDDEYLSKEKVHGTDLSKYDDPVTEAGYEEVVTKYPVYEGDTVKDNGLIEYAVDLQLAPYEEVIEWKILASILNSKSSCLNQKLLEDNIQNSVTVNVISETRKPILNFEMEHANEDQMQTLKDIAQYTIEEVSKNGVPQGLIDATLKDEELSTVFNRDKTHSGVSLSMTICTYWSIYGKTDYFKVYEEVLDKIKADKEQNIFKKLAKDAIEPRRSALVAVIPEAGLAEKYEEDLHKYLSDMKANMSEEEIENLVAETKSFNEWNEEEKANNDFMIDPQLIEDVKPATVLKDEQEGITFFKSEVDSKGGSFYKIFFDLSGMTREELIALNAYSDLWFDVKTSKYDTDSLDLLSSELLYNFSSGYVYPDENKSDYGRPMLAISWKGLSEDFPKSLELLLNIIRETDLTDKDAIRYILTRNTENYDTSRGDAFSMSKLYSTAANTGLDSDTNKFILDIRGQDLYHYISDIVPMFDDDEKFDEILAEFDSIRQKAFSRTNMIFGIAASQEDCVEIEKKAMEILTELPEKPDNATGTYELPVLAANTGVCVEASQNYTHLICSFYDRDDFKGEYIPFIYAANDKYVIPNIRFKMGAYSAAAYASVPTGFLIGMSYSDPNVKATIDVLKGMDDFIGTADLTEEELKGYILLAYADLNSSIGQWESAMRYINRAVFGLDETKFLERVNGMKKANLSMQQEAAGIYQDLFKDATIATLGNESKIKADKDAFDEIINLKE
ncbi:insulinase family protein [Butyrivibrio sp. JL13D10]|uniref:insulinase family protein n=1 Tax=Butyrivibrio sp. JL13D10 TaxID=3236815 RepID=UPI0038B5B191